MAFPEAIAREKEEQRHVEHIYHCIAISRKEGMAQNHQHNANAFGERHRIVKLYWIIHCIFIIMQRYEVFPKEKKLPLSSLR
jgi:hypothetical protein